MDVIIYKTSQGISVISPTAEAINKLGIKGIAKKDVPVGVEYKVIDKSLLPLNKEVSSYLNYDLKIDLDRAKKDILERINPLLISVSRIADDRVKTYKEQNELSALDPAYKTDLTKTEYIQLLKDKEKIRQLSKKSIQCIEGITTEQGLLDAIDLFKTDFTKMAEVDRVLKEVDRRLAEIKKRPKGAK